jgi:hypothetical protein
VPDDVPRPPEPVDDGAAEETEPVAGDDGAGFDDSTKHVVEINSAALEGIARMMREQNEIVRRTTEPVTSALAALQQQAEAIASMSSALVAGTDTAALQAIGKALAGRLPKFEMPPWIDSATLQALNAGLNRVVGSIDFDAIKRALQRGSPPNWHDLGDKLKLSTLLEVSEAGLPTAWIPRALVLQELLDADEIDRAEVFATRRQEVIEDCRTVLNDVTSPELAEHVDLLNEALDVAADGRLAAAQSLAASIFDTVLRHTIKPQKISGYYKRVKDQINDRYDNASIAEMRWGFVHVPAIAALDMFDQPSGDPIPAKFNRHASAHAVGRVQYTPANAVIALALATSLVREAHQEIADAGQAAA